MFGTVRTKAPSCCIELRFDDCSTSPKGPHYVRKRKRGVYEMPNPTIAAGTVIAVHEERRRKSSSFFVIGIDLTGRPLQLHGLGELLPATLTHRFVGVFVVVPASRFRWIVSAAEGTF
jgi:hypothetical protein